MTNSVPSATATAQYAASTHFFQTESIIDAAVKWDGKVTPYFRNSLLRHFLKTLNKNRMNSYYLFQIGQVKKRTIRIYTLCQLHLYSLLENVVVK